MPFPPLHPRSCRTLAVLAALAGALAGCESVRPEAAPPALPRSAEAAPPPPPSMVPTSTPGKHATRRDYYVLYHDFELDKSDPLFAELDALPDQRSSAPWPSVCAF